MFPAIQVQISGMDRCARYALALDVVPVNEFRYRFHGSRWTIAGSAAGGGDVMTRRVYIHPDSPMTGQQWMSRSVSFIRLKLTNNLRDSRGYVSSSVLIQFPYLFYTIALSWVASVTPQPRHWFSRFGRLSILSDNINRRADTGPHHTQR